MDNFEIIKNIFSIGESDKWKLELNIIQWNIKNKLTYDLRRWSKDHNKCSKGLTLSKGELELLRKMLNNINEELIDFN